MRLIVVKKNGFSLLELMVVVAIIAFLTMISVPTFRKFLHKSKRSEAYMNLRAIYASEKAYWADNGKYSTVLSGKNGIGWKPEGAIIYTYGFPGSEGTNYFIGSLGAGSSALSQASASSEKFVAIAAGDIDGDGKLDVIGIDENNKITIITNDLE